MNIQKLIRSNIMALKPYSSARDEFKDFDSGLVFLDANENPFNNGVNRYPDPQQLKVKMLLSKIKGLSADHILLGNGSDEVLDLIVRAFCEPNQDSIIITPPTYGMYEVIANVNAVNVIKAELTHDFQPQVELILKVANAHSKVLFLCSPNNPTANSFDRKKIEELISKFPGIVVIDEAYIDFSKAESWLNRLKQFQNLIITQTLSKAYGLAGIRLGICYASAEIISVLNKIKPPYNINELTQQRAIVKIQDLESVKSHVEEILKQRDILIDFLNGLDYISKVYPTDANFILIKVDDATKRYNQLIKKGIVTRNRTNQPLCNNCLRITVGTSEENNKLTNALKNLK